MHGNSGHYSRGHAVYVGSGLALGAELRYNHRVTPWPWLQSINPGSAEINPATCVLFSRLILYQSRKKRSSCSDDYAAYHVSIEPETMVKVSCIQQGMAIMVHYSCMALGCVGVLSPQINVVFSAIPHKRQDVQLLIILWLAEHNGN